MLKIGVIGYGYWGPNLVRNFMEAGFDVAMVSDLSPQRRELAQKRYPSLTVTHNADDVINNPSLDAVAIATPVRTHFDLAMRALTAGKHVFVEKPITSTAEEAERLIEMAGKKSRILMVDHTFLYTGAVRKIRQMVDNGELGDLYYYDSSRVNLGLFQSDVNVLWDLAVHDLAIMDYVIPNRPRAVSATGISNIEGAKENLAFLTVFFDEPVISHITVNWLAPVKIRRTLIGGSKKMLVYDDLEPSEKIKVYDKGVKLAQDPQSIYNVLVGYRIGDMYAPNLEATEALNLEAKTFRDCIQQGQAPMNDGAAGLQVVRILEAATESMARKGQMIELKRQG